MMIYSNYLVMIILYLFRSNKKEQNMELWTLVNQSTKKISRSILRLVNHKKIKRKGNKSFKNLNVHKQKSLWNKKDTSKRRIIFWTFLILFSRLKLQKLYLQILQGWLNYRKIMRNYYNNIIQEIRLHLLRRDKGLKYLEKKIVQVNLKAYYLMNYSKVK